MDDEKFEKMMEHWASQEVDSAPKLRPTKAMYQMVKAKKRNMLVPIFARWATVGVAALAIVLIAVLHPGLFRPSSYFEQARQEEFSIESQDEERTNVEQARREKLSTELQDEKPTEPVVIPPEKTRSFELQKVRTKPESPASGSGMALKEESIKYDTPVVTTEKRAQQSVSAPAPVGAGRADTDVVPLPNEGTIRTRKTTEPQKSQVRSFEAASAPELEEEDIPADMFHQDKQSDTSMSFIAGERAAEEKQVGSKNFQMKDGVWSDSEHTSGKEVITIKYDSHAHSDLITAIPELKVYFEMGNGVIVNIGKYSIEIAEDGKTEFTAEELHELVQTFKKP